MRYHFLVVPLSIIAFFKAGELEESRSARIYWPLMNASLWGLSLLVFKLSLLGGTVLQIGLFAALTLRKMVKAGAFSQASEDARKREEARRDRELTP
ncbi:MAG: hypothetical protein AAF517_06210 [Planctomycetota bacterium]